MPTCRVLTADADGVSEAAALLCDGRLVAFPTETVYGLGAALGFSLVLALFAAMRERLAVADVPGPFKGASISLVTAGLMSLAFMGFAGLVKG